MLTMNVKQINPFIEGVIELFQGQLASTISRGEIGVCTGSQNPRDIVAFIGLSGPTRGTVALSFPTTTVLAVVSKLLNTHVTIIDETVSVEVAKLVNMVAGSAKPKLVKGEELPIDLSLPTVVRGNNFSMDYPSQSVWLEVPFTSSLGEFSLRVTFEQNPE